uniref:PepSY domain-containing protein n=1 Tax=uncultured Thiotrichaceae bacterium TaxID=298394 RepID=A0A6S6U264_9GAMM|nr:MAG: PepSY domain-containing protein [uncultured Thiotrichaceae bacterium]
MNKHIISGLVLATTMFTATAAMAGPDCTEEPQDKWMSVMDMQKKIINDDGFTIDMFKVTSGNCYEIYGKEQKEGSEEWTKTEIYFHPVSGEIVQQKDRS